MSAARLDPGSRTHRRVGGAAAPADPTAAPADAPADAPVALCVRQSVLQWGYLVAWFGLLFVASPFLLRPEDWREKLWLSAAFLCLVVFGHMSTYAAVDVDGLTLGRWLRRTTIPWSNVTSVEVTGRWIRRVCVVCADGTTVLPAPTSGPLNWDRRFQDRAAAVQAAARQAARRAAAEQSASAPADGPVPIPRPRLSAE
ncbi:MAG: hypothetical protein ACXV5Q_13900 [Frankiaceae bacterium]